MNNILIDGQTLATPEMERGIGQVFKRLLEGMVVPDISHRWFITIRNEEDLKHLGEQTRLALEPVLLPPLQANGEQISWCQAYGTQIQTIIDSYKIKMYWNPNPLMINVHYPFNIKNVRKFFTIHDLIPLVFKEKYIEKWPLQLQKDYFERLNDLEKHADLIITVSNATAEDFSRHYPNFEGQIKVIHWAPDFTQMWPYLQGCSLSDDPYILYVGGFDPRKNMENALRAFAEFVKSWHHQRFDIQFKIVCAYQENEKNALLNLANQLNVASQIDLTGFVDDQILGRLFRSAHLFFFPSLYEGFGLPVLDAMACGVPIVASQISSIPEICGSLAIYCNPTCVEDMANKLRQAWDNREKNLLPNMELVRHARQFHWRKTCSKYLEAFNSVEKNNNRISVKNNRKYRVAYLCPWPPLKNGIADYSYLLAQKLKNLCELFVFYPQQEVSVNLIEDNLNIPILPISSFLAYKNLFDIAVYHIGNNAIHINIYELAWEIPGIVVIHDYNIHPFFHHLCANNKNWEKLYKEALCWYGKQGQSAWQKYQQTGKKPNIFDFALTEALAAKSQAVIVHNRWTAKQFNAAGLKNIFPSHLGAYIHSSVSIERRIQICNNLGLDKNSFYIGVFGFINLHKRLESIIASISELILEGYPVILLTVGEINDARINIEELTKKHELSQKNFIHTSYVDSEKFDTYMSICDIVINLRYPTLGESSGSLFRAFTFGIPSIVSNVNQFSELPDSIAWKVDVENNEVEQLTAYIKYLCQNPQVRASIKMNAKEFIKSFSSFDRISEEYYKVIKFTLENKL